MIGLGDDKFMHAAPGFGCIAGIREAPCKFLKEVKRVTCGLGVTLGEILTRKGGEPPVAFVKRGKRL